ncbi:filamin/ABP280 repeat-containing protein [Heterostelium album PN500]|uniref:Filamin/ABP280 repeat-containing protein n=1 Tax=Heterostelium pallidum (strain ATCC 26659 / Pp 5 / PN500) TaxID=670386 RepID=D3B8R5_HETP5|nr:filamin/ABP280 repeat-containing protein [Heterostelium album PN500]EFA82433.1 filamin/ABP280 repeat-containing protein [Heterostelium album PN500]|eukprot:XP_020434550.1 filamin/ABP280 repeat-containing protein [Heterostelium album PN500]
MLQSKDNITKKCAVRAVSNLSSSFDTKKESSIKLITCLLDLLKSATSDLSLKVLIYKSFSNFCRNAATPTTATVDLAEWQWRQRDKYNTKIVNGGGKIFLRHLLENAKSRKISIIKPIAYQEVSFGSELGHGVSGTVWKGTWNGHVVAIKYYNEDNLAFDEREYHTEGTLLTVLQHPNILHCIGGSPQHSKMFIVCDYLSRGSLNHLIHSKEVPLSNYKIVHFAIQAAAGMEYLHSLGIIHRDLKSGNLLIDDDWNVRVCDFGLCRIVDPRRMTKGAGTACYMAVEVLKGSTEYSQKADVFSFGMLLWECFAREIPYHDKQQIEWVNMVLEEAYRLPIPDNCPPELASIIKRCWDSNPDSRPTFTEIHQELTQIRDRMKADGIFEVFEAASPTASNVPATSSSMSPPVTAALSLTSSMIIQPPDLNNNNNDSESDSKSNTDEEISSSLSSGTGSPIGTTSPTPSPSWRKWEMSAPDRQKTKRISAFRVNTYSAPPSSATSPKDLETEPIPITTAASASTSPTTEENTGKTVTNTFSTLSTDTSGIPFSLSSNEEEFSDTSSYMSSAAVSALSSRSNSTLSMNDNFHPNFNPSELDGLLKKSVSEHQLRSSTTNSHHHHHYFNNTIKPIPNRLKQSITAPLMGTTRITSINKIDNQPTSPPGQQSCISPPKSEPINTSPSNFSKNNNNDNNNNNNNNNNKTTSFSPPTSYKKIQPIVKLPATSGSKNITNQ